jgi:DnaJ-class molecular chaperone
MRFEELNGIYRHSTVFVIMLVVCMLLFGCNQASYKEVTCSECKGVGTVTYGEDHWIVINKIDDAGTYSCPMCNGSGKLYEERKASN